MRTQTGSRGLRAALLGALALASFELGALACSSSNDNPTPPNNSFTTGSTTGGGGAGGKASTTTTATTATTGGGGQGGQGGAGPGGGGHGGSGGTGGTGGQVDCNGPNNCYKCPPVAELQFLNQCTASQCSPFDNAARLPLYNNGNLPPLP
jgi:hypothetical protein